MMFNPDDISEQNINNALKLHLAYACEISDVIKYEEVMNTESPYKSKLIVEHQAIQDFLHRYFKSRESSASHAIFSGDELLKRRMFQLNKLSENGVEQKEELVHIGIDFIHEQFNGGKLFPIGTFFTLVAGSGVGKSDYLYRMIDKFLMQDYMSLLVSLEFGEQRLATLFDSRENGGKDRLYNARKKNNISDLFVNFKARTVKDLELLIDVANSQGVRAVFIDSFGEFVSEGNEYNLQKEIAIMLNSKTNDYNMFIVLIAQTKTGEQDGEYTVRGGTDLFYKPDLSIHIKKLKAEDISGDRIVHLFKNRDADINGKTILTQYDFDKREPKFKCDYLGLLHDGKPVRKGGFGTKKE